MSIRLTVEASDTEVENLLKYLDTRVKEGTPTAISHGKIALLQRTLDWLKPTAYLYGVNKGKVNLPTASVCLVPPSPTPSTYTDPASEAIALAGESLDRAVRLRDA